MALVELNMNYIIEHQTAYCHLCHETKGQHGICCEPELAPNDSKFIIVWFPKGWIAICYDCGIKLGLY